MRENKFFFIFIVVAAFFVTACGGSSSESEKTDTDSGGATQSEGTDTDTTDEAENTEQGTSDGTPAEDLPESSEPTQTGSSEAGQESEQQENGEGQEQESTETDTGDSSVPPPVPPPASGDDTPEPTPLGASSANSALEPALRKSQNGVLTTSLTVAMATVPVGDISVTTRSYEGSLPGPTLRVRPGDTLNIKLLNTLPENPDADAHVDNMNVPHRINTTNIHTHGLHVSPSGSSDNILLEIEPGESFDYVFKIPADHPAGTFWYHPHRHGSASDQLNGGMSGALIVEGDIDQVPEIAVAEDLVLLVNELCLNADGTVADFDTCFYNNEALRLFTVNGRQNPTIKMKPGEVQRWRVINGAARSDIDLEFQGHKLAQIAVDGLSFAAPREIDHFLMTSGNRTDLLVKAGAVGTYQLKKRARQAMGGVELSPEAVLATIVVEGETLSMALPTALPQAALVPIADNEIVTTRDLTFDMQVNPNNPRHEVEEDAFPIFQINKQQFDPNRVDQVMTVDTAEEWTIRNTTPEPHPFHIHTNPFLVTKVNGVAVAEPFWRDTVTIDPLGSITFRTRFADFIGRFAVHCHMLEHEDLGMMSLVEVVAP